MGGLGYSVEKLKSGSNIVVDLCSWKVEPLKVQRGHWTPPTPILGSGEAAGAAVVDSGTHHPIAERHTPSLKAFRHVRKQYL